MSKPNNGRHILVVEDSYDTRQSLVRALELEGYGVLQAADGQAAMKALEDITPDLILSDLQMPRMSGVELFMALRQSPCWLSVPFIFLTAHEEAADTMAGRVLGVEDFLIKPIETRELLAIINARLLRSAEHRLAELDRAYLATVNALSDAIECRDAFAKGHVDRIAAYARRLAQALNWSAEALRHLEFGARLHDVGMVTLPERLLNKPGPLTPEERNLMRRHPQAGADFLVGIGHLQGSLPYVLYHHERWDGRGYPFGIAGDEIPVEGRLLAIVDVYDALTSPRSYRPARRAREAVVYLRLKAGVEFDPRLVPVFLRTLEEPGPQFQPSAQAMEPATSADSAS